MKGDRKVWDYSINHHYSCFSSRIQMRIFQRKWESCIWSANIKKHWIFCEMIENITCFFIRNRHFTKILIPIYDIWKINIFHNWLTVYISSIFDLDDQHLKVFKNIEILRYKSSTFSNRKIFWHLIQILDMLHKKRIKFLNSKTQIWHFLTFTQNSSTFSEGSIFTNN